MKGRKTYAIGFMTPPDPLMKQLHAMGGKLIVVHGSADPVFSVADIVPLSVQSYPVLCLDGHR